MTDEPGVRHNHVDAVFPALASARSYLPEDVPTEVQCPAVP
ncbi:hypothetical protein [Arcanobacterium phocisimile]|nr:hypothetical protein [Arcanobacterium phocisimile]